ncbi:hypothetical protein PCASD_17494 [Puccinia coronata f. sp. avenae]|uniref:PXA domain-containing protein n=1 Tax=Puccinia coronata f. sp. avenae TaxID=200324 RepID=A0A2N5TW95_9BASI|nr:hypothetical protein PCASD_17494 [Puccinia coronata f. sp. avenae]
MASDDVLVQQLVQQCIKQFILSWYSPLTELSAGKQQQQQQQPFIRHIHHILGSQLVPQLTLACNAIDFLHLLTVQLPVILTRHLQRIQHCHALAPDYHQQLFLQSHPHPAIRHELADQRLVISPTYLRLLVEAILKAVLPDSDYRSEPERYILREIILNLVLLSLIEKLSQPELIHSILLAQLRPSVPIVPAAEQNPIPEIPSVQQEETEQYHHVTTIRSSIDQLSSFFHTLLLCLLRLPAFLGALIHHITLPAPIPIPNNPRQFEPILDLVHTLLGNPPHLVHIFWLLKIAARLFHGLLTKIVAHVIYDHLLSPAAVTSHLLQLTSVLSALDPSKEGGVPVDDIGAGGSGETAAGPSGWPADRKEESGAQLEEALSACIPTPVFSLIYDPGPGSPPLLDPSSLQPPHIPPSILHLKTSFVRHRLQLTLNSAPANQALILDILDLLAISLFPSLLRSPPPPSPLPPH